MNIENTINNIKSLDIWGNCLITPYIKNNSIECFIYLDGKKDYLNIDNTGIIKGNTNKSILKAIQNCIC